MKQERYCEFCGELLTKSSQKKYCSDACARKHQFKKRCDLVDETGMFPASGRLNETDRRFAKRYLENKHGHVCAICGRSVWNNDPIPLVADHLDGNSENHSVDNLRLICPNCDAQQSTYKSRNLTSPTYIPGDRSIRHAEDYDKKLSKLGLTRCAKKERTKGICLECGVEFSKRCLSQKYCSRACADKNRTNQWTRKTD
jgi:hypothetical protein